MTRRDLPDVSAYWCACTECRLVMSEDHLGYDKGAGIEYCPYCGSPCDLVFSDEMTDEEWDDMTEDWEMI